MLLVQNHHVTQLRGVGSKVAAKLKKLHLQSLQDLILHLPVKYEDRTQVSAIDQLLHGEAATVVGTVTQATLYRGRRSRLLVTLQDATGCMRLLFFNYSNSQAFVVGQIVKVSGEVKWSEQTNLFEMMHPDYTLEDGSQTSSSQTLTPFYPLTEGLSQIHLRKLMHQALLLFKATPIPDLLPVEMRLHGLSFTDALCALHHPCAESHAAITDFSHPAQERLIVEEMAAHLLGIHCLHQPPSEQCAYPLPLPTSEYANTLFASLPFTLTNAQVRVMNEIQHDLHQERPMMRLVQGDVGSGKTLVAALSALHVLEQGYQVVLLAPTELLAEQHAACFKKWFLPFGIEPLLLVGSLTRKERQTHLNEIQVGQAQMIVGTHAVFQPDVQYQQLALVIIDEQHRFGVEQRLALFEKGRQHNYLPHQLLMTATPIPRTLALTAYSHVAVSMIDELPQGRQPITTSLIASSQRKRLVERIRHLVATQQTQVYWVCTLIEEGVTEGPQAAQTAWQELTEDLPELKIGLVHGKLASKEKHQVMEQFKQGELHILVATTVIEVGVDVPNANVMVIENPERLGLAQLHQLRGRIGRGNQASYCLLLSGERLSAIAKERLAMMRASQDGFVLAEKDLELRGPGELTGFRQTGMMAMKIADLVRDRKHIVAAQSLVQQMLAEHPTKIESLMARWLDCPITYYRG
ncbi:MAG: ATP-dependent DNA helicase RecG [Shewanellaceae bacterium]|nr:ATP-dependent DNA helicase RecG [Shewanellaceae bacterium]